MQIKIRWMFRASSTGHLTVGDTHTWCCCVCRKDGRQSLEPFGSWCNQHDWSHLSCRGASSELKHRTIDVGKGASCLRSPSTRRLVAITRRASMAPGVDSYKRSDTSPLRRADASNRGQAQRAQSASSPTAPHNPQRKREEEGWDNNRDGSPNRSEWPSYSPRRRGMSGRAL